MGKKYKGFKNSKWKKSNKSNTQNSKLKNIGFTISRGLTTSMGIVNKY